MKTTDVILSDPHPQSEESLGRRFNGLSVAYDIKNAGGEVNIPFLGTGTRWPEQLPKEDNPLHALYTAVEVSVRGVSSGCADFLGANPSGLQLISENKVPGTSGLPSLHLLQKQGHNILIF